MVVAIVILAVFAVLVIAAKVDLPSNCTHDCDQGRKCTCKK
jgi:hypothetical protein